MKCHTKTMKIADSISINAPMDRVFEVFTDLEKAPERIKAITDIKVIDGPGKLQVGTKWSETRVLFGKEASETMWVTDLSANKGYVVEADSRGTKYRTEYTFEQIDDTVEVTMVFEGKPHSISGRLLGLMVFLFKNSTKKALHKDLVDLKNAAESNI